MHAQGTAATVTGGQQQAGGASVAEQAVDRRLLIGGQLVTTGAVFDISGGRATY